MANVEKEYDEPGPCSDGFRGGGADKEEMTFRRKCEGARTRRETRTVSRHKTLQQKRKKKRDRVYAEGPPELEKMIDSIFSPLLRM